MEAKEPLWLPQAFAKEWPASPQGRFQEQLHLEQTPQDTPDLPWAKERWDP